MKSHELAKILLKLANLLLDLKEMEINDILKFISSSKNEHYFNNIPPVPFVAADPKPTQIIKGRKEKNTKLFIPKELLIMKKRELCDMLKAMSLPIVVRDKESTRDVLQKIQTMLKTDAGTRQKVLQYLNVGKQSEPLTRALKFLLGDKS